MAHWDRRCNLFWDLVRKAQPRSWKRFKRNRLAVPAARMRGPGVGLRLDQTSRSLRQRPGSVPFAKGARRKPQVWRLQAPRTRKRSNVSMSLVQTVLGVKQCYSEYEKLSFVPTPGFFYKSSCAGLCIRFPLFPKNLSHCTSCFELSRICSRFEFRSGLRSTPASGCFCKR